jgi:predicted enzyme related to lactoylglutathione lyase
MAGQRRESPATAFRDLWGWPTEILGDYATTGRMLMEKPQARSQIVFLYYHDLQSISSFYEEVLGLELVDDQEWARIYRVCGNAFVGIVASSKGFHQPQEKNAVLVTLVVDDVPGWYEYLLKKGTKMLTEPRYIEEIQVRGFFFEDPGGYTFEVQQFLNPDIVGIFHPQA